jgi:hypothetical protein
MKILHITITLLLLIFSEHLSSQQTSFEFILSTPLDEFITDIIETPDGSIYFSGQLSTIEQPDNKYALLAKLDRYGSMSDSNIFHYPEKSIQIRHIIPSDNQLFTIVSTVFDKWNSWKEAGLVLNKMDINLNLSDQTNYYFPPTYLSELFCSQEKSNGNITVGGAFLIDNNLYRPFIYEFSPTFDSLKAKVWLENDDNGIVFKIKEMPDGNYWIIKALRFRYEMLDSTFNVITRQKIPDFITGNYGVKWDTDTSFYLLGDTHLERPPHTLGFIRQFHPMDTTGHLYNHWRVSDTVDFPAEMNGIDFKNKDSIFMGGTRNMWLGYYNPWPSWFIVLQTDSLLNIRWERFYGGDAYYMMGKVVATNDGGCLVAGTRYDYLNTTELETDIIILKLNSDGLILGDEENPIVEMHEAIVYPNPGNEMINVRIAAQHKHSLFELFDLNGRQVLQQNFTGTLGTVNTGFLQPGTYIYKITNQQGLNESGKWLKQ